MPCLAGQQDAYFAPALLPSWQVLFWIVNHGEAMKQCEVPDPSHWNVNWCLSSDATVCWRICGPVRKELPSPASINNICWYQYHVRGPEGHLDCSGQKWEWCASGFLRHALGVQNLNHSTNLVPKCAKCGSLEIWRSLTRNVRNEDMQNKQRKDHRVHLEKIWKDGFCL